MKLNLIPKMTHPDADMGIPPLADDPEFAAAKRLLDELWFRERSRAAEAERMALERALAGADLKTASARATITARLAKFAAGPSYFAAGDTDPAPTAIPAPALARGVALLRGGAPSTDMTRAEKAERLRRDEEILREAINFQSEVVETLRHENSRKMAERMRAKHDGMLVNFYRACQALAAEVENERKFQAEFVIAGYDPAPDIIGPPFISAPLLLGSETRLDSQISMFRQHLERRGILK